MIHCFSRLLMALTVFFTLGLTSTASAQVATLNQLYNGQTTANQIIFSANRALGGAYHLPHYNTVQPYSINTYQRNQIVNALLYPQLYAGAAISRSASPLATVGRYTPYPLAIGQRLPSSVLNNTVFLSPQTYSSLGLGVQPNYRFGRYNNRVFLVNMATGALVSILR